MKMIGKGENFDSLYILDTIIMKIDAANLKIDVATSITNVTTFVNNVSTQVWHNRLGHLSLEKLDILKIRFIVILQDLINWCSLLYLSIS